MKKRTGLLFWLGGLTAAAALGFVLREPIRVGVILPLTKLFWLLRGYYGSFSQASYFIVLIVIVIVIGLASFHLTDWITLSRSPGVRSERGTVRQVMFWLERARHSIYGRWYVAHILANLALDLLGRHGRGWEQDLQSAARPLPPEIEDYLYSGLRLSPAEFSRREVSAQVAALEENPEQVVACLESILENTHDRSHS